LVARKPISKVLRESRGHFSKSVLLWVSGQRPGGNAAGQHGLAEAVMFSKRGFGGEAPDYLCSSKKTRKRFLFYWGGLHIRPSIRRGESISNAEVFSPTPHILGCRVYLLFCCPHKKSFCQVFFKKAEKIRCVGFTHTPFCIFTFQKNIF
jgi:hypothetical protein